MAFEPAALSLLYKNLRLLKLETIGGHLNFLMGQAWRVKFDKLSLANIINQI